MYLKKIVLSLNAAIVVLLQLERPEADVRNARDKNIKGDNMKFSFTIKGMSREQAEKFLDLITHIVDLLGLSLQGGYHVQKTK